VLCHGDGTRDLVLNQTSFKFFVKMGGIKDFRNPHNHLKTKPEVPLKKIKLSLIYEPRPKVPFEIKNKTTLIDTLC